MKNFLTTAIVAGAVFCSLLPASADVDVRNVTLGRCGHMMKGQSNANMNNMGQLDARVTVGNTWKDAQEGPVKITLLARKEGDKDWQTVKTWEDVGSIPSGRDVTVHAYSFDTPLLDQMSSSKDWELKAVVDAPHHHDSKTVWCTEAASR